MNAERVIVTAESGALLVNVWGDLARQSDRRLPRPRVVVGTFVFYGLLGLASGLGRGVARFAAAAAVATFLTVLVGNGARNSGQGGRTLIGLLNSTTRLITGGGASS